MRSLSGMILGVATSLAMMTATPLGAQSITGLGKASKPTGGGDVEAVVWQVEWTSWAADEVVAELVHRPLKALTLDGFEPEPETKLALKGLVRRTEAGVLGVLRSFSEGEMESFAATTSLEALVAEYQLRLEDLTAR